MQLFSISLIILSVFQNVQCSETVKHPHPGLKYLLMWTSVDQHPFSYWKTGQEIFLQSHCEFSNCYVTNDRDLLGDINQFDAVAFNGRNIRAKYDLPPFNDFPKTRLAHQKYIFVDMESADIQSVCDPKFDDFFNLTATYKLDSDILFTYFTIKNKNNETVGPRTDMTWVQPMSEIDESLREILRKKTKAVAWFASHCDQPKHGWKITEDIAKALQQELKAYNLTLDIFYSKRHDCNPFICPLERDTDCEKLLKNDYFFYLALENSFADDFVGREVMKALLNLNVPIVMGGANYSRFLPPGSYEYIHPKATKTLRMDKLAAKINRIINNPSEYEDYFRWRNNYEYSWSDKVCRLCAALNDDTIMGKPKVYKNFREWWNPKYEKRCSQIIDKHLSH